MKTCIRARAIHGLPAVLILLTGAVFGTLAAVAAGPGEGSYRLGANDTVHIQVFGEDDLTLEAKVGGDGDVIYPLLGRIPVAGKTVSELADYLTGRLAAGYLKSPRVSVAIVRYRNVYITGPVRSPGGYPFEEGLTVQKLISIAGGLTEKAEKDRLKLTRLKDDVPETLDVDGHTVLAPNDMVLIGEVDHRFFVNGEVKSPGGYPYREGLTVHKALAMAGGLTERAERGLPEIVRRADGVERRLPGQLDVSVLPDDIIVVAEGRRFYVSGEVRAPGRFLYENGLTIQKALSMAGGTTERADHSDISVHRMTSVGMEAIQAESYMALLPEDIVVVPQTRKFYVNGEIRKPGDYPYEKGLTVHKAITMAGGFTDKAAERRTRILRIVGGEERSVRASLDSPVLPEDIIVVPESFF